MVLLSPHFLLLSLKLISVSTQMQGSMENNPVQLGSKGNTEDFGIFSHSVDTDINFRLDIARIFGKFESDDICIIIMTQIGLIDLKQFFI